MAIVPLAINNIQNCYNTLTKLIFFFLKKNYKFDLDSLPILQESLSLWTSWDLHQRKRFSSSSVQIFRWSK